MHLGIDTPDNALRALTDLDLDAIAANRTRRKVTKARLCWDHLG